MSSLTCSIDLHDGDFFGLTMDEQYDLYGLPKNRYKKPTQSELKKNRAHIKELSRRFEETMGEDV